MADGLATYFNRVGHVEFAVGNKPFIAFKGLDFKFSIEKPISRQPLKAKISIAGLSLDTINSLVTWAPWQEAASEKKFVRVYGGYEDTGEQLLFQGFIIQAMPTKPPNIWLEIEANAGIHNDWKFVSWAINKPMKFIQLCHKVCDMMNWNLQWLANSYGNEIVRTFDNCGSVNDLIKALNDIGLYDCYYRISDNNDGNNNKDGVLVVQDKLNARERRKDIYVISPESGLLDIPKVTATGVECRCVLDTSVEKTEMFRLRSNIIQNASVNTGGRTGQQKVYANGDYVLYKINYSGHFRGQDWTMTLFGRRPGVSTTK